MKKKWMLIPVLLLMAVLVFKPEPEVVLDRAMREQVIDTLAAKLNDLYVVPDKAARMKALLHQHLEEGRYDRIGSGYRLAAQLTAELRIIAGDRHLKVRYQPVLTPGEEAAAPAPATRAEWEQRTNFIARWSQRRAATRGVLRIGHMAGNIGYLKISAFPDAYLMTDKFAEAMDELAGTDGLIMDLRDNKGGDPQAVALLISYFVDRQTRLNDIWDRETGNTVQYWTEDKLDGKRYGGRKPVMILAGPGTASAGEDFTYTMQALKRATVVGEPTWGGAHPVSMHRLGGHFLAEIPSQRSVSPITHGNWEGVGVIPDIEAKRNTAMAVARTLMQGRLQGRARLVAMTP